MVHINALGSSGGILLAQAVHAEHPHIPVLFTSGVGHSLEELQQPGCRFLLKPFPASALLSAIRELLAGTG